MRGSVCFLMALMTATAAVGLPPVMFSETCPAYVTIMSEASALFSKLASLQIAADFDTLDMEGDAGDGIPDKYQIALLAAVMCSGDWTTIEQYNTNKQLYGTFCNHATVAVRFFSGGLLDQPPRLDQRLALIVAVIDAHEELQAIPQYAALYNMIKGLQTQLTPLFGGEGRVLAMLPLVTPMLNQFDDLIAAMIGLSSEGRDTLLAIVDDAMVEIENVLAQAEGALQVLNGLVNEPVLTMQEKANVRSLADDLGAAVTAVEWIVTVLPGSIEVYGVQGNTPDEPFSAASDYDGDGNTNAFTYQALKSFDASPAAFVEAASGENELWTGNPNLPAVHATFLAVMAVIIMLAGALTLRKI